MTAATRAVFPGWGKTVFFYPQPRTFPEKEGKPFLDGVMKENPGPERKTDAEPKGGKKRWNGLSSSDSLFI
jgi:hypothetical protein